jgi:hypothetical protein
MTAYKVALSGVAGLLAAGSAWAEPTALAGEALRKLVSGRTIILDTPVGALPISYRGNGTLAGKAPIVQAITGPSQDQGRWWIADDRVCQQWSSWLDGKRYCYQMRLEGLTVHWRRDDGRKGTARLASH